MQRPDSAQIGLPTEDVPSAPASYNEYLERRLNESVRDAYTRGLNRGARGLVLLLCIGFIFGCLAGFYLAISSQSQSCRPSPMSPQELAASRGALP